MLDIRKVTGNNPEAIYFIRAWGQYLRLVDDTVDESKWDSENLLSTFAMGATVYASTFYRRHTAQLQMPILVGTSLWDIANEWEKEADLWKRHNADVLRHADIFLMNAICQMCAGWEVAMEASKSLLAAAYVMHADKYGVPK